MPALSVPSEGSVPCESVEVKCTVPAKAGVTLSHASRAVRPAVKAWPAVDDDGAVAAKCVVAPGSTVNGSLSSERSVAPEVAAALMTTPDSALRYVTPLMVVLVLPAVIVPVSVPPSVPVPVVRVRTRFVLTATPAGSPTASIASTLTLKALSAFGFVPPLTDVIFRPTACACSV